MMGLPGPKKKFDDIFSCVDIIHHRDGQTDGRTQDDCIDCAYAQHRAVEMAVRSLVTARFEYNVL